jgi:hypothetical protein
VIARAGWHFLFGILFLSAMSAHAGPLRYLPLDDGWRMETKGAWQIRKDHRDLLAMRHPWQPSEDGAFAQATRTVEIPPEWSGPVALSFYCSDDYHTDTWRPDGTALTAEGFIGHRFLQVMVNEKIVWSQDIASPVVQGQSPTFRVPLPVRAGEQFRLGLLAFDRLTTLSVTPEDFFQAGDGSTNREGHEEAQRFHSQLYWGDLALVEGDAQVPPGKRPVEDKVAAVHERRWPLAPMVVDEATKGDITLTCDAPGGLPKGGAPVRFGLPFPPGKVRGPNGFQLKDAKGTVIYADREVTASWPDGSVRWCLVDMVVPPDTAKLTLNFKKDTAKPPKGGGVRVSDTGTVTVDAGPFSFAASPGRLLHDIKLGKETQLPEIGLSLQAGSERATGTAEDVRIIDEGPLRLSMLMQGGFEANGKRLAGFHLYLSSFSNQSMINGWLRVFNEGEAPLPLRGLSLTLLTEGAAPTTSVSGQTLEGDFSVTQSSVDSRTLEQSSGRTELDPAIPFFVQTNGVAAVIPRARERFPRGLRRKRDHVELQCIDAPNAPIVLTPGEASSHEFWLGLGEVVDSEALANFAERPPVFSNPEYFCATGAFGPAWPVKEIPKYDEKFIAVTKGQDWAAMGAKFGVRDFPDMPYFDKPGNWSNNYYNRTHGAWAAWLATGEADWRARAIDISRLVMDVAVIHSPVPGQDWLGAIHGPGENHVPGPWSPTLRTRGLWLHDMLTGEPETVEAYMGVADFVARRGLHQQSPSVRDHAGPMDAIVTAYDASGEPQWLDEGAKRVAWAWERMDRRRGVWPETHGSMVYRGNVPWMVAQLAGPLFEWYTLTGDVEAAQQVVGMAESMICENTPWDQPGAMSGYSHNPHFQITAAYDPLILPILFAAYELTEDTFFLDAAKAQWKRWLDDPVMDSAFNTFWHTPWLGSCVKRWAQEQQPDTPE